MCVNCDYRDLLESAGLEPTTNRVRVLEIIGNNQFPLTAADIFTTVERSHSINRVTVYRILELLVDHKLVERLSAGRRAAHYGLAPNDNHAPHHHFFCTRCGRMDCLNPGSLDLSSDRLRKTFSGEIERIEIRVDGVCRNCLKSSVH
ncbi:MAG: transcriptional repressor [Desulfofustis sp.]|nr:transcriptional repressor [Desulfofustis sp.]RZW23418.1 MAG: transcriptional repressor [Desulfobulbaceae bacterium]